MDLNYQFGDVTHRHRHLHQTPDSHLQVVEHSLLDWCHDKFPKEPEKCQNLEDFEHHNLINHDGFDKSKITNIFDAIVELNKFYTDKEVVYENDSEQNIILNMAGYEMSIEHDKSTFKTPGDLTVYNVTNKKEVEVKSEDNRLTLELNISLSDGSASEDGKLIITSSNIELHDTRTSTTKVYKFIDEDPKGIKSRFFELLAQVNLSEFNRRVASIRNENTRIEREQRKYNKLKSDPESFARKLEELEKFDTQKYNELIILIVVIILTVISSIYIIYNHLDLKLS